MVKEQLHKLKQTSNSFQCRGIVMGTESKKFYKDGIGSNKDGISVNFGVNIAGKKPVYITLTGYPKKEVYYYKRGETKGEKGNTKAVAWKDRKKSPGEGYNLIGTKISTGRDEDGNNINTIFTEYDAVNYLHENLKDGDSVFIKGNIEFRSWTGKNGQTVRSINLVPNQISYTKNPIDFDAEDFTEMCEFENTLVFQSIDKEEDENGKHTGRAILSGYSIGYNSVENVSFIIPTEQEKLAKNLHKAMKTGYSIKTYGRVNVVIDTTTIEDESGWGDVSPMERLNAPVRREYIVYRADPNSIEKKDYDEDSINEAIRKIKAAKTAKENFGEKPNIDVTVDDDDWGSDDDMDEDNPW